MAGEKGHSKVRHGLLALAQQALKAKRKAEEIEETELGRMAKRPAKGKGGVSKKPAVRPPKLPTLRGLGCGVYDSLRGR